MGHYTEARSTILLATHCLICGLPLRDPHSVETGIGPQCAAKHGYNTQGNPETRTQVSKLIHSAAEKGTTAVDIFKIADQIEALGFPGVATKIRSRFTRAYEWETKSLAKPVLIRREEFNFRGVKQPMVWLHTPFEKVSTPVFNSAMKDAIPGSDRTGSKDATGTFWWVITAAHAATVNGLLLQYFPGRLVQGPKGSFIVGEAEAAEKADEDLRLSEEVATIRQRLIAGDDIKTILTDVVGPVRADTLLSPLPGEYPVPQDITDWGSLDD